MSRLDLYKKPILLRTFITNDDEQSNEAYDTYSRKIETAEINKNKFNEDKDFYHIIKEMIFEVDEEGRPLIYYVFYTFNSSYNNLETAVLMHTLVEGSKNDIDRGILHELAMSVIYNIPVFPNHEKLEEELGFYYNELYENGFEMIDKDEKVKKYKLAERLIPIFKSENEDLLKETTTRIYSSAEINYYKNKLMEKLKEYDNAQYIINKLKDGINELSVQLNSPEREENKIQAILTNYPILFGTEYIEVLDKHNFGSEYEADYILKRYNGLYDIVEIEASTLDIYTKQGNPSRHLVHAEQQIMDWLQWIEHNNPYAREKIKKLYSPKGYVVIGRSNTLTETTREKLRRRNLVFRDKIEIITYDDLLENAKLLLDFLSGNKIENE